MAMVALEAQDRRAALSCLLRWSQAVRSLQQLKDGELGEVEYQQHILGIFREIPSGKR